MKDLKIFTSNIEQEAIDQINTLLNQPAYNDRKARAKRRAELKGKMEAKVKELQETAIFEMLAKEDAGLAEMLKEFKELG